MELQYSKNLIVLNKELNALDDFVISFTKILQKNNVEHVLVSGYVSILFGRNRASEDVDLIAQEIPFLEFQKLWNRVVKKFKCVNASDASTAYNDYLKRGVAIRFSYKDDLIPNAEFKFAKNDLDKWTLKNKVKVVLNDNTLFISPIELQISFKLMLGSEKDVEDAKYLYELFKERLDKDLLSKFNDKLKVGNVFNKYLS